MSDLPRWRVPSDADFRWRAWDGEFVVYHANSGETHRLDPVAAEVLAFLDGNAASTTEIIRAVLQRLELPAEAALGTQIEPLLLRFQELGLIEAEDDPRHADGGRAR